MDKRSQLRITVGFMAAALLLIVILTLGGAGKTKLSYSATVTVKGGVISADTAADSIYIKAPGDKCVLSAKASGQEEIRSEVTFYQDASMTDTYFTTTASSAEAKSEALSMSTGETFIRISRKIAENVSLADGNYVVDYKIVISAGIGFGKIFLVLILALAMLIAFVMIMRNEEEREGRLSKKRIRLRRKVYMSAFYVLVMLSFAFSLLSAFVGQFPFTVFQAGMIAILVAGSVLFIQADMSNVYEGIRRKRSTLVLLFAIIAGVNLFAFIIGLISGGSEITPVGTGMIGDWVVNLIAGLCFFAMLMEMLMKNARDQEAGVSERRSDAARAARAASRERIRERERIRRDRRTYDDEVDE